jgi:malate dehydrogenase (oxaloacetate-decarboxylating)
VSGAGAAGVAVSKILIEAGIGDIAIADSKGIVHAGRTDLTPIKTAMAEMTNKAGYTGTIEDAMIGADVYIGLSAGKVDESDVAKLAPEAMIFAMANPDPEIHPDVARHYARVVATGRSDFPNQINNVLAFPGVFRGALDVRASAITEVMKLAAANALCDVVGDDVAEDYVIPSVFDPRVGPAVAAAVADAARAEGVARI